MQTDLPRPRLDELLELRHQAHSFGLASHHLVNSSFSGLYASIFRGQGLNFEEVREYREGDDIRNMDWKVTARTGDPHLKVFREERERNVMLCVDTGAHMDFGTRNTFKSVQAARAAALLGWAANRLHDRVGGMLFNAATGQTRYLRPTKDRRALWRLLQALTDTDTGKDGGTARSGLPDILLRASRGIGHGGLLFVIADFNSGLDGLKESLVFIRQHHSVVLLPVDDPADSRLPDMGEVVFRSPTGQLLRVDTSSPAGRERFQRNWLAQRDHLQDIANHTGTALIALSTGEDVHRSLVHGLERRVRQRAFL